ncbi:MAG: phospholipase D-like domain-containing protein [Roseburia sp.]|nr:phospholipase D-like domain-containing protein [Roseburia sp.]
MRFVKFVFSRFFICLTIIAALIAAIIFLCVYIHSLLPAAAALALSYLLSLIAALYLLSGNSPAEFKCVWLILIVVLPVSGAVLYFLSVISRAQKLPRTPALSPSSCTAYEYFTDGATFLDRLTALVSSAKKQVLLEFYIISKGHIWGALYRELKGALDRGVQVKIIYDGLGSALRAPKKDFKELAKSGAEIKVFNRILPLPATKLNFRDHRKIAVIDCDAVFLGGVNVADEYANLTAPHGYWKDGGALFFGDIAEVYSRIFLSAFGGKNTCSCGDMPRLTGRYPLYPVADGPERTGGDCEDMLAAALYSARERVYLFTPYLCTGDKLHDALIFAVRRGADVKIIIPAVPDKKFTYAITRTYCERLTAEGVQVFTYTPGFMHFKGAVCDDAALLGSYNFDFRSMRLNYECGVFGGGELADEMARDFAACLALSKPLNVKNRNGAGRLTRSLLRLFAPLV